MQQSFIETPKNFNPESEHAIALEKAAYQIAKRDFAKFVILVFKTINPMTPLNWNWHLDYLAYMATRTLPPESGLNPTPNDRIFNLIINVPPRSLKSVVFSVAFKAFILGHFPHERIIGASFSADLSKKFNSNLRDVMRSAWYKEMFPETQVKKDTDQEVQTTKNGHSKVTSLGGNIIGQGGNYLISDDILDPETADSDTQCAAANDWFDGNLYTRRDDKRVAVTIIVMQRLREMDLTGYLLAKNEQLPPKDKWHLVCLPFYFEDQQIFHYQANNKPQMKIVEPNEMLNPNRDTPDMIQSLKVQLTPHKFATQFMQKPAPAGGGLLKLESFKRYSTLPTAENVIRRVQSWDTAIKSHNQADFSVCTTWLETQTGHYLEDLAIGKWEYPQLNAMVQLQADIRRPDIILIEDKASGSQLLQDFRFRSTLPVVATMPKSIKDWKVIRAASTTPLIENGQVYIPQNAEQQPWWAEFEKQLMYFPNGKNDDIPDSITQYLDWAKKTGVSNFSIRML